MYQSRVDQYRSWFTHACRCLRSNNIQSSLVSPLVLPSDEDKKANAGALTNFEVLDFLRSRGAAKDPTRVIAPIAASEFKVYDYLVESAACNQTRESINELLEKCKKYDLAKAEILNIINIRPASPVEIDPAMYQAMKSEQYVKSFQENVEDIAHYTKLSQPVPTKEIIEESEKRMGEGIEDLIEMVITVLPPPPNQMNTEEEVVAGDEEIADGEQTTTETTTTTMATEN
ncbi:hypothetical protein CK203_032803 [Vitis vinifera]|uniref:DNA-directed RNA polymerase III subunit RPC9 n=1 Tax=Vitis vinifera TaxID=29760 RepID=A0A438I8G1_VITVI|nr:hypothetical protein CK203_032803 [Vitis vinifera]